MYVLSHSSPRLALIETKARQNNRNSICNQCHKIANTYGNPISYWKSYPGRENEVVLAGFITIPIDARKIFAQELLLLLRITAVSLNGKLRHNKVK